jgi:hypothetical protein
MYLTAAYYSYIWEGGRVQIDERKLKGAHETSVIKLGLRHRFIVQKNVNK